MPFATSSSAPKLCCAMPRLRVIALSKVYAISKSSDPVTDSPPSSFVTKPRTSVMPPKCSDAPNSASSTCSSITLTRFGSVLGCKLSASSRPILVLARSAKADCTALNSSV